MTTPLDGSDIGVREGLGGELPQGTSASGSPPPPPPHEFPILWLLDHLDGPLQYRALTEVAQLERAPTHLPSLAYGNAGALELMSRQRPDGTWNGLMLRTPALAENAHLLGAVGTIPACHRLLEYGWEGQSPPLMTARRLLFRLLAQDDSATLTFELAADGGDTEVVHRNRALLRTEAASVLAHAGYEADPRLRGAANRMIERAREYLASPLAGDPWVRAGGRVALSADAAPPSPALLSMLAFMPHYRLEQHEFLTAVVDYFMQTAPKHDLVQVVGSHVLPSPSLLLGDPLGARGMPDADVPYSIWWLEVVSRLGLLRRHEGWMRAFERLLDQRGPDHVWRPGRGAKLASTQAVVWPAMPLQRDGGAEVGPAEITFRLGLIARYAGRPIDLV